MLFGCVTEQYTGILRWYAFNPLAIDVKTLVLALIAGALAFRFHRSPIEVVGAMAVLGIAVRFLFGA